VEVQKFCAMARLTVNSVSSEKGLKRFRSVSNALWILVLDGNRGSSRSDRKFRGSPPGPRNPSVITGGGSWTAGKKRFWRSSRKHESPKFGVPAAASDVLEQFVETAVEKSPGFFGAYQVAVAPAKR
jgi:hypothetical protein